MTVNITARERGLKSSYDLANGAWFTIIGNTEICYILNLRDYTNEVVTATASQARQCAIALIDLNNSAAWRQFEGQRGCKDALILDLMTFFKYCSQKSGFVIS